MKILKFIAWSLVTVAGGALLTHAEDGPFFVPGAALAVAGIIGLVVTARR